MTNLKKDRTIKRNPLDDVLETLEEYSEGVSSEDLMSSGE